MKWHPRPFFVVCLWSEVCLKVSKERHLWLKVFWKSFKVSLYFPFPKLLEGDFLKNADGIFHPKRRNGEVRFTLMIHLIEQVKNGKYLNRLKFVEQGKRSSAQYCPSAKHIGNYSVLFCKLWRSDTENVHYICTGGRIWKYLTHVSTLYAEKVEFYSRFILHQCRITGGSSNQKMFWNTKLSADVFCFAYHK